MNININLHDTYPLVTVAKDLRKFTFISPIVNRGAAVITVKIAEGHNEFLDNYLNLSFGPEKDGIIDDFAIIPHVDPSRMFSTVLYCALLFLKANPHEYLVIDGSDFRRFYWYYRILQSNYEYFHRDLEILGLKYFARLLRGKDKFADPEYDDIDVIVQPHSIENRPLTNHKLLFNVLIFYLRHH